MAGKGALRRNNAKKSKAKQERKKAAAPAAAVGHDSCDVTTSSLSIPTLTEDDLLAFQLSHFGDETKPELWFVDAETALNYEPEIEAEMEDDELGYYEDGTRRTLTDEQIKMFRHSEVEQILREERLRREEDANATLETTKTEANGRDRTLSRASDASSMDGDLMGLTQEAPPSPPAVPERRQSQTRRQAPLFSTDSRRRPRKEEVPYGDRNKRKWEDYIEDNDPVEGSRTHRRIVRELDEQREETKIELDY